MKYRVTANFIDKHTKVYYPAGSVYETADPNRAEELREKGFIGEEIKPPEPVKEPAKPKGKAKKGKADADQ